MSVCQLDIKYTMVILVEIVSLKLWKCMAGERDNASNIHLFNPSILWMEAKIEKPLNENQLSLTNTHINSSWNIRPHLWPFECVLPLKTYEFIFEINSSIRNKVRGVEPRPILPCSQSFLFYIIYRMVSIFFKELPFHCESKIKFPNYFHLISQAHTRISVVIGKWIQLFEKRSFYFWALWIWTWKNVLFAQATFSIALGMTNIQQKINILSFQRDYLTLTFFSFVYFLCFQKTNWITKCSQNLTCIEYEFVLFRCN